MRLFEHIPLEQGLRIIRVFKSFATPTLFEHIPLEQGLRLHC